MPIEMNSLFPQNRTHYYLFPRLLMFLGQNHFPLQATLFSFPLHFIYFVFVVCDCGVCVCVCVYTHQGVSLQGWGVGLSLNHTSSLYIFKNSFIYLF